MKKINVLKENRDFNRIIENIKPYKYKAFAVYLEETKENINHFGISVSKKLINAVGRNKIKRQIRQMISKNTYKKNINCIIIVRKSYLNNNYINNEIDLYEIFNKINIIEGDKNEKK